MTQLLRIVKCDQTNMVSDRTNFCRGDFIFDRENSLFEFDSNLATEQINSHNFNRVFQGFIQIIWNVLTNIVQINFFGKKLSKRLWITKNLKFYL